ncbi:hypothetical protein JCM24511_05262, partial [Saitozyma sp. JCM 24511]
DCRNPLDPKASLLWSHLQRTFSAQGNCPQQNNNQRANFPHNNNACCEYHHMKGHSTESCMARKSAEADKAKNKPQAKVAQTNQAKETVPTVQIANLDANHDSDSSAYITAVPTIKSVPGIFIIDSGASHHMVTTSALLTDVKQTTPVSVKIGDGTKLLSRSSGSLTLGPVALTNILVVPGLQATFSRSRKHRPRSFGASLATRQLSTTPRRLSALRTFKADSTPSRRVRLPPLRPQSLTDSQYFEVGTTVWAT